MKTLYYLTIIILLILTTMELAEACEEGTDMTKYYICEGGFCKR